MEAGSVMIVRVLPEPLPQNLSDVPSMPVYQPVPSSQPFLLRICWGYFLLAVATSTFEYIQPETENLLIVVIGLTAEVLSSFVTEVIMGVMFALRARPTLALRFESVPPPSSMES